MIYDNSDEKDANVDEKVDIEGAGLDNDKDDVEGAESPMAHLNPKNHLHKPFLQTITLVDLGIHTGEVCYYPAIRSRTWNP